jgi:hypothetical protein
MLLKDSNGSLIVYNGADGAPALQTAASQAEVVSEISGQRMGYNYWSAVVMWVTELPMALHVSGTVTINAYISSTAQLSGLFSGGGYAMGLVDIDENNNQVKQFIAEVPYTIGSNPFTATPARYSQSVNVDYVFSKGHKIGFVVGLGATVQSFSATVYFGSADKNSSVTLPVIKTTQTKTLTTDTGVVAVSADSAVEALQYDKASRTLTFKAEGIAYTSGFCEVTVPKTLMTPPFTITQGSQPLTPTVSENTTHYKLSFTHTRSNNPISVAGSEPGSQTVSPSEASVTPDASPQMPKWTYAVPIFLAILLLVTAGLAVLVFRQKILRRR